MIFYIVVNKRFSTALIICADGLVLSAKKEKQFCFCLGYFAFARPSFRTKSAE